ncbi:uncharacterized protein TNCV_3662191 [Trichonephila clavipes]|nr:uncharacterized protein TNCV_3662191 [Trichonephila clavipes]
MRTVGTVTTILISLPRHQRWFIHWALGRAQKGPDKLDLTRFSGYKVRSSSAKGACRFSAPWDQNERKLALPHTNQAVGFNCQVIYSQFGLAIHQNDHQAKRRFVEWAQNEIAVVPDFHKRILFSDEAHFWLNGYVNKQNCHIWSEANPQVYVETPLHPEKLTVWCALWAGGPLLQKQ